MSETDRTKEQSIRETAYYIWEREGRPPNRAADHWNRASKARSRAEYTSRDDTLPDEEKIIDGRPDVNLPALLTKDVSGG